jgi:hypothetical protein
MSASRVPWRRSAAGVTLLAFFLTIAGSGVGLAAQAAPAQKPESPIAINHDELKCVTTDIPPEVDAAVTPGPQYEKGYVYFKAAGTEDFYYAPMKGQPASLSGLLPRPLPETKAIDYYVKATDVQDLSKRTKDYTPPVVPGTACKAKGAAPGPEGAGLTIGLTREGQNPVPQGFDKRDIKFVILFSGAVVTLAAALQGTGSAAAGGGGVSTGLIVAGGVLVAGGIAGGIAASHHSNTSTPTPSASPTPTNSPTPVVPTPTPTSSLHFVEADATWSGEGDVDVRILDSGGNSLGSIVAAGCSPTTQRTERVVINGALPNGTYRVMVSAKSCGSATPAQIAVAVSALVDSATKCTGVFLNVPTGGSAVQACTFSVP